MRASSGNVERHNEEPPANVGRAVVSRLASLGHDVVRDVQAASRRPPSGIALRVADYEDAFKDFTAITGREPESLRDFLLRATSGSQADCIAGSPFRERHRS